MEVYKKSIHINQHQLKVLRRLPYRSVPSFLGEFSFCTYKSLGKLPNALLPLVAQMREYCPEQEFNTAFIQRYQATEFVRKHRDPFSNKGYTLIAVFGDFEGAISEVEGYEFQLTQGDLLKLECTIAGKQGPSHSVSPILSGTRYAIILNTIK